MVRLPYIRERMHRNVAANKLNSKYYETAGVNGASMFSRSHSKSFRAASFAVVVAALMLFLALPQMAAADTLSNLFGTTYDRIEVLEAGDSSFASGGTSTYDDDACADDEASMDGEDSFASSEDDIMLLSASGGSISPRAMSGEMLYFCKWESANYDQGLSSGDYYHAMGYFQFDNRYDLGSFLYAVYSYNPSKYSALKVIGDTYRWDVSGTTYSNGSFTPLGNALNSAWHACYSADPTEFSNLQNDWAYTQYYSASDGIVGSLKAMGIDVDGRSDSVKSLVWGMANLFGKGGGKSYVEQGFYYGANWFIKNSGVTGSMDDETFVTVLCDYIVNNVASRYPNQPQYWNGWQTRYRDEKSHYLSVITRFTVEGLEATSEVRAGQPVSLKALVSGDTEGLSYKFVWQKGNWASWGVVDGTPSESAEAAWTPAEPGDYTVTLDVIDGSTYRHATAKVKVGERYTVTGVSLTRADGDGPSVGDKCKLNIQTSGDTEGLKYKIVYERGDWASWGTLRNADSSTSCDWVPNVSGTVNIWVDVFEPTGKVKTVHFPVTVTKESVDYNSLSCSSTLIRLGESVSVKALLSGQTDYLTCKFVWSRNNWAEWGVAQMGSDTNLSLTPSKAGDYQINCDVILSDGSYTTKAIKFSVWDYAGPTAISTDGNKSWGVRADLGTMAAERSGEFLFKFVWTNSDWSKWGVLRAASTTNDALFNPTALGLTSGRWDLYVDVRYPDGTWHTKKTSIWLGDEQEMTWKAQQYYSSTNWLILADTTNNHVAIFSGSAGNWKLQKYWSCTSGAPSTPTVTGQFTIGSRGYSFGEEHGYSCYYWTQFRGAYLFHSVKYYANTRNIMDGRLGVNASAGCIRLDIDNAKWLYDYIPGGTKVVVYK